MNCPPDTNPKSRLGVAKPGIHAIPPVALLHLGRGMEDGEVKYGLTNWREHEVSASVYYDAAARHLMAWWDGEQVAPDSGVHHLGHVMSCCAILLDAEHQDQLNDNRPSVPGAFAEAVKAMTRPQQGDEGPSPIERIVERMKQACVAEKSDLGLVGASADELIAADRPLTAEEGAALDQALIPSVEMSRDEYEDALEEASDAGAEELALRILSVPTAEDMRAIAESFVSNRAPGVEEVKELARAFFHRGAADLTKRKDAVVSLLNFQGVRKIPELTATGRLQLQSLIEDWETEDDGDVPMVERRALETGETARVEVPEEVSFADLESQIRDFLRVDPERKRLAQFNNFRQHIGSFLVAGYSPNNRARLSFYLDCAAAGVTIGVYAMDEALRMAGFEFGAA